MLTEQLELCQKALLTFWTPSGPCFPAYFVSDPTLLEFCRWALIPLGLPALPVWPLRLGHRDWVHKEDKDAKMFSQQNRRLSSRHSSAARAATATSRKSL